MASLGELEAAVMRALWAADGPLPARELIAQLSRPATQATDAGAATPARTPALTTVLTVLSRLESKGMVASDRSVRPRRYRPTGTPADHTAELMRELLDEASDREAALARFVGTVDPREADTLRRLLG